MRDVLFSILKIEILILLWAILKILTPILRHVQSSIVCYCLFNIWIAVFRLFLLYVEAWLIQIPIFEVKNYIWALILLKAEIVVICQFLFKVLVSHINFRIKSLYITWFPPCNVSCEYDTVGREGRAPRFVGEKGVYAASIVSSNGRTLEKRTSCSLECNFRDNW